MTMIEPSFSALVLLALVEPAAAHDPYCGMHDPTTGGSCCGFEECRPIPESDLADLPGGGYVYEPKHMFIPERRVMRSPDNRFHICIFQGDGYGSPIDQLRCFMAPKADIITNLMEGVLNRPTRPVASNEHYRPKTD